MTGEVWLADVLTAWRQLGVKGDVAAQIAELLGFELVPKYTAPTGPEFSRLTERPVRPPSEPVVVHAPVLSPGRVETPAAPPTGTPSGGFRPLTPVRRGVPPALQRSATSDVGRFGDPGGTLAAAISPGGRWVLFATDRTLIAGPVHDPQSLVRYALPHAGTSADIGDDGRVVVANGSHQLTIAFDGKILSPIRGPDPISTVEQDSAGSIAVALTDGGVRTCSLRDQVWSEPIGPADARTVLVSPDGSLVGWLDQLGQVTVCDRYGRPLHARKPPEPVDATFTRLTDDGRLLYVGASAVIAFDLTTGLAESVVSAEPGVIVDVSRNGQLVLVRTEDGFVVKRTDRHSHRPGTLGAQPLPRERPTADAESLPLIPLLHPNVAPSILITLTATDAGDGDPDLGELVELVTQRQLGERWPRRRPRPSLFRGLALMIDRSPALAGLQRDLDQLRELIRGVVGPGLIEIEFDRVPAYEPGEPWPPTGMPVLLVSDFGLTRLAGRVRESTDRQWHNLIDELARQESPLVALVPYPPDRWPTALRARLPMVSWDITTSVSDVRRAVGPVLGGRRVQAGSR